jgi:hypothetical protein
MYIKLFFLTLTVVTFNIYAKEVKPTLAELNSKSVQVPSENSENHKYYTLSLPHPIEAIKGVVVIKRMDGGFYDFPIFIESDGRILREDKLIEKIFAIKGGYGERFELLLAAINSKEEAKPLAKTVIIPFPLIVKDDKGHFIELKAEDMIGHNFTVHGSGFAPNEHITFTSHSGNETGSFPLQADKQGTFVFGYNPAVIGKTEGPFELTFKVENAKPIKLKHYWGKIAFREPSEYRKLKEKYPLPKTI